jgi:D-inositol-3-phosphate glycosyltransferase
MTVSLLTGGGEKSYALDLLEALVSRDIAVDFIGNDDMSTADIIGHRRVNFLNLRGNQNPIAPILRKMTRVLKYYLRLVTYACRTDSRVFHILWFNKFLLFDRSILNVYYKLLGKRLVFTAHNIDARKRDDSRSVFDRASLKVLYRIVDHILVHTNQMKLELIREFKVPETKITVIPFGINNTLPRSGLTQVEARAKLGLDDDNKVILFFGNIAPYKGLEYGIAALNRLKKRDSSYRLVIAGQVKKLKKCQPYWDELERTIDSLDLREYLRMKIEYIPDQEVEVYFKASDVLIMPYRFIYQSGVLFLSYSFGLPVIAADVGSLREDIVEGQTGLVCRADDPDDLADAISRYFYSYLYKNLEDNRKAIIHYGNKAHSWDVTGNIVASVYKAVARRR